AGARTAKSLMTFLCAPCALAAQLESVARLSALARADPNFDGTCNAIPGYVLDHMTEERDARPCLLAGVLVSARIPVCQLRTW
ncbi:MAG: hypothetical protein ACPIOQ_15360, partial [Promethearchaeia archaeon]